MCETHIQRTGQSYVGGFRQKAAVLGLISAKQARYFFNTLECEGKFNASSCQLTGFKL
jgi:hypothetical protein